jgi:AbrB family looped-hinge helix DNA binding protein
MPFEATIDAAGRVVIPYKVRRALHLLPGTRLRLTERGRAVVLEPIDEEPVLIVRDGVKLLGGAIDGPVPSYSESREEWLDELTESIRRSHKPKARE